MDGDDDGMEIRGRGGSARPEQASVPGRGRLSSSASPKVPQIRAGSLLVAPVEAALVGRLLFPLCNAVSLQRCREYYMADDLVPAPSLCCAKDIPRLTQPCQRARRVLGMCC